MKYHNLARIRFMLCSGNHEIEMMGDMFFVERLWKLTENNHLSLLPETRLSSMGIGDDYLPGSCIKRPGNWWTCGRDTWLSELMAIDLSKQMIHSKFKRVELARIYSPTASECYTTHHLHSSIQLYISVIYMFYSTLTYCWWRKSCTSW